MRFIAYQDLGDTPNIVVDGAPAPSTLLTLSHWPHSGTPAVLKDDLSAQIVFRYLERPALHVGAEAVSNNHFDEDGLIGVYTLLHPEQARARRDLLVDIASAGDFGTYRSREAARVAFILAFFASPERSPLPAGMFSRPYAELSGALYLELLGRLPEFISNPGRFRQHWAEQEALLDRSEAAIRAGTISIDERRDLDLAVVTIPERSGGRPWPSFARDPQAACHPFALYSATRCYRVLVRQGRWYELQYRYESWVQYISARPLPRVDLTPLAEALTRRDRGRGRWEFDGVDETTPRLHLSGAEESRIEWDEFRRQVEAFLASAPPAWNPYDPS